MANIITGVRIVCSAALLFCAALSLPFYILYLAAGFTDMIDGAVARKTGTVSGFGSKFDTFADLIFTAVCLIKLLPVLDIPLWVYLCTAVIAVIKVINILFGYIKHKKLAALHTVPNKLAGALLFVLPMTLPVIDLRYSAAAVCAAAAFAAVHEGYCIITGKAEIQ